eukprot:CAMPEP_0119143422 /NCGR_PEP_ID=MMETSP1310-20130426/34307_1 /TAXON_ID=464262 /ORGANISM="Genus nov. species nov., Strain RCC2339" /LENGTH=387 /DNA_ID=CAMNT_0007135051 /DNA_START=92 /DNA_END=1252 /DNA_ORIENTATION=+
MSRLLPLLHAHETWFLLFYYNQIPETEQTIWRHFAKYATEEGEHYQVADVNCEASPSLCLKREEREGERGREGEKKGERERASNREEEERRSGDENLPVVYCFHRGQMRVYDGPMEEKALIAYAEKVATSFSLYDQTPFSSRRSAARGIWGEVTASINWCESDYAITPYIAEFWNTLSSLSFCLIGVFQYYLVSGAEWEFRFRLAAILLFVVGLGSVLFHATLWYSLQLSDELPMTWIVLVAFYSLMEDGRRTKYRYLAPGLLAYAVISTLWQIYLTRTQPILHELQFGLLMIINTYKTYLYVRNAPYVMKYMFWVYVLLGNSAFFLCWIPDQLFCEFWQLNFNPQLHAWWHILMCIATHYAFILGLLRRARVLGKYRAVTTYIGSV